MMFVRGDIVRLFKGWSPMCVIGFRANGDLMAKYLGKYNDTYITPACYKRPEEYYSYCRPVSGFAAYDKPYPMKVYKPMTTYKTIPPELPFSGKQIGVAQNGNFVLENEHGVIRIFKPSEVVENVPFTFRVKSTSSNMKCDFLLSAGVAISVHDMILSNSGDLYTVIAVDTKSRNPAGTFVGRQVVTKPM